MKKKREFKTLKQKISDKKPFIQDKKPRSYENDSGYGAINIAFKAVVISLAISKVVIPMRLTISNMYPSKDGEERGTFLEQYARAFIPGIIAGQLRGTVSVTSKHISVNSSEMEASENAGKKRPKQNVATTKHIVSKIWEQSPFLQSFVWSQIDLLFSGYHMNKMSLEGRNITIPNSLASTRLLPNSGFIGTLSVLKIGYGFNTASGVVTFGSIIHISQLVKSVLPQSIRENSTYGETVSGALAGAISATINFPINHLGYKVMQQARYDESIDMITSPSTFTMFKQEKASIMEIGLKTSAKEFMLFAIKGPLPISIAQSMIIVGMLSGLNSALGDRPVDEIAESISKKFSK